MAWQLCCRGMCKNLLRSDGRQRNYKKTKFPSNLDFGQKIVSESIPRTLFSLKFKLSKAREFCIILNVTHSELAADSTNVSNHQVVMTTNQPIAILSTVSVHVAAELYSPKRSSMSSPLTCLKTCLYNVVYATWYFIVFLCIFVNCKLVSGVCHKHFEHVVLPRFLQLAL